jgi:hypothetical protein
MKWLLVYFTIAHTGNMQHIEFPTKDACENARKVLESTARGYAGGHVLVCLPENVFK